MRIAAHPFPKLIFPLHVVFTPTAYFLLDDVFEYGAAATAFLCGELASDDQADLTALKRELEDHLNYFGGRLYPYADPKAHPKPEPPFPDLSMAGVACEIRWGDCMVAENTSTYGEQITFRCLRDFLLTELHRAIQKGNAPRQCRLCGQWFLHLHGEKFMYCKRVAPGEVEKTCRVAGPRAGFEQKLRTDDVWRVYKRAYKKYYARLMKGNMTREELDKWVKTASSERDRVIYILKTQGSESKRAALIEELQRKINET